MGNKTYVTIIINIVICKTYGGYMQLIDLFKQEIHRQLFVYKLLKCEKKLKRRTNVHAAIAREFITFYENTFKVYYVDEEIDIIKFNNDVQEAFK